MNLRARIPLGLVILGFLDGACARRSPDAKADGADEPLLRAVHGDAGNLLSWDDASGSDARFFLEREEGEVWTRVDASAGVAWDAEGGLETRYRLASEATGPLEPMTPDPSSLSLSSPRAGQALYNGSPRDLRLAWDLPDWVPVMALRLVTWDLVSPERERFLDGDCLVDGLVEECWRDVPSDLRASDERSPPTLPEIEVVSPEPMVRVLEARLVMEHLARPTLFSASSIRSLDLGRTLVWGDLHAHSNLSNDGCEDPEHRCADRSGEPAGDFFAMAQDTNLDFAALTDHAEWTTWYPDGGPKEGWDIWETQQARVREAEAGPVLPILGAEWTWASTDTDEHGYRMGGHKTLLFDASEVCRDYRVAASRPNDTFARDGGWYAGTGEDERAPTCSREVFEALDRASLACDTVGVLTFAHHTGLRRPQPVDWRDPDNAPDPRYEPLVEILSEHGCSECGEAEAEGCGWGVSDEAGTLSWGSVQAALSMGYRLGFLAGTDSHDARPGSTSDGPSSTSGPEGVAWQAFKGGVTAAMVEAPLDRASLFRALRARHTLADSGARVAVAVAAEGANGRLYLPGDALPGEALPCRVRVDVPDEALLDAWEILLADGTVIMNSTGAHESVDLDVAEPFYLRFRFSGDQERAWASPFFP